MQIKVVMRLGALCLLAGGMLSRANFAQMATSGSVVGTVTDPSGDVISNAVVELDPPDSAPHEMRSGPDGAFAFSSLQSGAYLIKVHAAGFAPLEQSSVVVAVGRTSHLALRMVVAQANQNIAVSAAPVTFDTSQTSSVVNIDRDRVEELPIPSRNYLAFVLLAPQVAPANPALSLTGAVAGGGSFSFGGMRPGSNAVYLDGVSDNDEYSGGSRTQLSPEAISDFQIVNHGFEAQSGGGSGGSIDVQTRTGLDKTHGDAFVFAQNGALNATPPLGIYPSKPDERRYRAGLALGGPIQRDKTFYYVAAEQELAHGQDANDIDPQTLSAIDAAIRRYSPLHGLSLATGLFATTEEETELSVRADRQLTAHESLMVRYAFTNARNVNDAFNTDELADRSARGSTFVDDNSLNATLVSTVSNSWVNNIDFELAQRRAVDRTDTTSGPGIRIAGSAYFGTPYFGNDRRFETHVEFADSLTKQVRGHLLQFGVRMDHVGLRTLVSDGSQGMFLFADLPALQAGAPDLYTQSFGSFTTNLAEVRVAAFAQDHWTATKHLTVDYGLRYDLNRLPSGLPQRVFNLSPRFGLAWTPAKALVVRGGFGTFFDRFELATVNRILEFDGVHAFSQVLEDTAAKVIFRSGQMPVRPLGGVAPSIWTAETNLRNPYSEVASLSAEYSLPWQTTLTAEYQYVHGVHLGRSTNANLAPPVVLTSANATALGVSSPTAQQLGQLVFSPARLRSDFDAVNQFATSASSSYNGGTVTLNRQFQDDIELLVGYTFSKTMDDASSDWEQPANPYALANERALSLEDQRHRLTLSGLWIIGPDLGDPADVAKNANPSPWLKALYGLEFAPIVSIASGFRNNLLVGVDSNREHIYPLAARPTGYARNSLATPINVDVDLRVLKMVAVKGGHLDIVAESFNLLNHRNIIELNHVFGSALTAARSFGAPLAAATPRRIQFSLDYEF